MLVILEIKILLLRNEKYLHVTYHISVVPQSIRYMYYLSACSRGLFKSYYCYVLFLPFEKPFKHYGKCLEFYFCIFLKKNSLTTNIRNKCVIRKIIFFWHDEKSPEFSFRNFSFSHFKYNHRFLFSIEIGYIRSCKELRLQKLIKFRLPGQYSF